MTLQTAALSLTVWWQGGRPPPPPVPCQSRLHCSSLRLTLALALKVFGGFRCKRSKSVWRFLVPQKYNSILRW